MGDNPILHEMERSAREIGGLVGGAVPEGVGFALHLWSIGEGGWATFVSNVDRDDHINALRELIAKHEEAEGA